MLPNLPTALEQGLAGVDCGRLERLLLPEGDARRDRRGVVNAATDEALDTPAVRKRIEELGLDDPAARASAARNILAKFVRERARASGAVRSRPAGVSAD